MRERSSILWLTLAAGDGRGPGGARPKPAVRNFFRVSHGDESPRTWTIFCYFLRHVSRELEWKCSLQSSN